MPHGWCFNSHPSTRTASSISFFLCSFPFSFHDDELTVPVHLVYFGQRNQAEAFVDFLKNVVPVNVRKSQELISMDMYDEL